VAGLIDIDKLGEPRSPCDVKRLTLGLQGMGRVVHTHTHSVASSTGIHLVFCHQRCRDVLPRMHSIFYLKMKRGCIQTFPDWVDKVIYAYNNKHSFRSNTKGYGRKNSLDWLTK